METEKQLSAAVKSTGSIVFDFDLEQCQKLDKAIGVIHEMLPDFWRTSGLATLQSVNTKKLSKLNT